MSITSSKKPNTSHFLGVDFGKAKIGLAVADSETRIAFGYGVLSNDKKLLQKLSEIVEKKEISKIIVGVTDVETKNFSLILSKLDVPIEHQNEMFSTQLAERNLKEKGIKKIKRFDDQESARLILQSWLDKKA